MPTSPIQRLYIEETDRKTVNLYMYRSRGTTVKRREADIEQLRRTQILANEKARLWTQRAAIARKAGRELNANRCEDKARDWRSRARQAERQQQEVAASA